MASSVAPTCTTPRSCSPARGTNRDYPLEGWHCFNKRVHSTTDLQGSIDKGCKHMCGFLCWVGALEMMLHFNLGLNGMHYPTTSYTPSRTGCKWPTSSNREFGEGDQTAAYASFAEDSYNPSCVFIFALVKDSLGDDGTSPWDCDSLFCCTLFSKIIDNGTSFYLNMYFFSP